MRREASASMKIRRKWAFIQALRIVANFVLAFVVIFACLAMGPEAAIVSVFAGVAYLFWFFSTTSRMRLYLRGRGRPSEKTLKAEIEVEAPTQDTVTKVLLAIVIVVGGFIFLAYRMLAPMFHYHAQQDTVRNIGMIRSSLSIYYGDHEGVYPDDLKALTERGKYLSDIPKAKALSDSHRDSAKITYGKESDDAGGWLYNNDPRDPNFGTLWVNCTHKDRKGNVWTTY